MDPKSPPAALSHLQTLQVVAVEAAEIETNTAKEDHPAEATGKAEGNVSVHFPNIALPQMTIIWPIYFLIMLPCI